MRNGRGQLGDALRQTVDVLLGRHAESTERTGNALLENGLETIPRTGSLAGDFGDLVISDLAGAGMDRFAFLDQRVEDLVAFALGLGKSAEAGQSDLMCGFLDGGGKLVVADGASESFQFLGHDVLLDEMAVDKGASEL